MPQFNLKDSKVYSAQKTMNGSKFYELFMEQLQDIYWSENALVEMLPKMEKAATSKELRKAIAYHLEETKNQAGRLEEVFSLLEEDAYERRCEAMVGIIKEAKELIIDTEKDSLVRDVALIVAAQKVEHYEIASYGSLIALVKQIGNIEAARLLEETLEEEKAADHILSGLALSGINQEASEE